uniref:(northern house mosquito) hypothetical protein n=1 Tax=Culex pipiens TaxID=7175 RepID=A0A8D8HRI8_CULPI
MLPNGQVGEHRIKRVVTIQTGVRDGLLQRVGKLEVRFTVFGAVFRVDIVQDWAEVVLDLVEAVAFVPDGGVQVEVDFRVQDLFDVHVIVLVRTVRFDIVIDDAEVLERGQVERVRNVEFGHFVLFKLLTDLLQ